MKIWLTPKRICIAAVIAALYCALTLALAPISYGALQCRVSEAFTVLPVFLPEAVPGLFIGCLLSNVLSPMPSLPDILFGSLATLAAAFFTYRLRHKSVWVALLPPVALNAVVVGLVVHLLYMPDIHFILIMLQVGAGEALAVYAAGGALWAALRRVDIRGLLRV